MTAFNYAVGLAVPRLTQRLGNGILLAGGLAVTLLGMFWLSRLSPRTSYLTGIALPMVLIGIGQGGTRTLLTAAGIAGVSDDGAGAAFRSRQCRQSAGGSLGLGILETVLGDADHGLAHGVTVSLTVGAGMLALALLVGLIKAAARDPQVAPNRARRASRMARADRLLER
jgi:hypothetical protein